MATRRLFVLVAIAVLVVTVALPVSAQTGGRAAGAAPTRSDFNGDGLDDLAVGVPYEDVGSVIDAGAVNVVYGSASGLAATGNDFWHQESTGIAGSSTTSDHFGWALAPGDFDGDGIADLAIGAPDKKIGLSADEGAVHVLHGTRDGLVPWQTWNIQTATANAVTTRCNCRFGAALAAGDFDNDGHDDLAIGMPALDLAGDPSRRQPALMTDAGAVAVVYGTQSGLSAFRYGRPRSQLVTPANGGGDAYRSDMVGLLGGDRSGSRLGSLLAAGDHDGAGYVNGTYRQPSDDLVIASSNLVTILFGEAYRAGYTTGGLRPSLCGPNGSATCDTWWPNVPVGQADAIRALAVADVYDGVDATFPDEEIFVGVPFADPGGVSDAGAVFELRDDGRVVMYTQGSGSAGAPEAGDRFGSALATGDFAGRGHNGLAVGVPNENLGTTVDAGMIHVLYSGRVGGDLQLLGSTTWSQGSPGVPGATEAGDRFGASLTAGRFDRGDQVDLAVGVPLEDFTARGLTRSNAGVVDVLLNFTLDQSGFVVQDLSQAGAGMLGDFEENDQFGYVLAR